MYLIKDKIYLKHKKEEPKIIRKKNDINLNETNPYLKININKKLNEDTNLIKKQIRKKTRINKIKNNLNNFNVISEERFTYNKKPFFKNSKNHFVNNGINNNNIQTKNTFEYLINYKSELINDKLASTRNQISGKKSYISNNHKNKLICIKLTNDGKNKMQIKDFENSNYLDCTNYY